MLLVRMLTSVAVIVATLVNSCVAEQDPQFKKEELEALLRAERTLKPPLHTPRSPLTLSSPQLARAHFADSQKISNVYDPHEKVQYTWNIEKQVLCPGVDGVCSKEEL